MTVVFGKSTMSRTQVQLWYNRLQKSQENINDDTSPDRPSASTTDENTKAQKKMLLVNRQVTLIEVTDDIGISFSSIQAIFTNVLAMKRAEAKTVPKLQNFEQKKHRIGTG